MKPADFCTYALLETIYIYIYIYIYIHKYVESLYILVITLTHTYVYMYIIVCMRRERRVNEKGTKCVYFCTLHIYLYI